MKPALEYTVRTSDRSLTTTAFRAAAMGLN